MKCAHPHAHYAVTPNFRAVPSTNKTVFAIDGNSGGVIGKIPSIRCARPQPVIARVNHFAHQRATHRHARGRTGCVNAHSEGGNGSGEDSLARRWSIE